VGARNGIEIVHDSSIIATALVSFYIRDPDGNVIQALYEPTNKFASFRRKY